MSNSVEKNRGLQKVQTSVPLIISTLQSGHPVRSLPYSTVAALIF